MSEQKRVIYTKEELAAKVKVPAIVEQDLKRIISDRLEQCGLYYRCFSRIKTASSMAHKFALKDYGAENKKLQDLVGVRINLYFDDDVEICQNIVENTFDVIGWSTSERSEEEFKPTKLNGVCRLPEYLRSEISTETWDMYIDDTFEIQIKTMFFEGWHEIEHDMRYKGSAFGTGNEALARKMNSILATLELCDDSVVGLIEDLGHQHYKDRKWNYMLRCHYRLKFTREPLHPYIEEIFDEDTELAKKFYKFKREPLLRQLWDNTGDKGPEITVNNIVKIVNQIGPEDERLKEAFVKIEHEKKQETESVAKRRRFEPFKQLGSYMVFKADTYIDLSNLAMPDAFRKATGYIYSWVKSRYEDVFTDLPESAETYVNAEPGYSVNLSYDAENVYFSEKTTHLDTKIPTRVWISEAVICREGDRLKFTVSNRYAEPADRYRDNENVLFSRPNFFGEIADNIGIVDVERMRESVRYVEDSKDYDDLTTLIAEEERTFPVIVFMASDGRWLDKFDMNYFAYLVGYYAHIKMIRSPYESRKFAKDYGLKIDECADSITVFYPGREPYTSYKTDIFHTTFEVIKVEKRKYWNENGCRAYRRKLVSEIRENNVL